MTTWTPATIAGADLEPGMFVDRTYRCERTGPKGGRYYVRAYLVESAVTAVEPTESLAAKDGIRVRFARGGAIFVLPEQRVDVRIPTEGEES